MVWFGSSEYIEAMADVMLYGLGLLLCHVLVAPHHRLVSHRKLRASARRESAAGKPMRTHCTVSCAPAAGPALQAVLLAEWNALQPHLRGSAEQNGVEPQPAPGPPAAVPGAGPQHRTAGLSFPGPAHKARVSFPPTADTGPQHRATTAHPPLAQPLPGSGGPAQRLVDVDAPDDSASTGYQPRNSGGMKGHEPGASEPSPGAPIRGVA